jgi:cell wall-associated NlpC family hydrolase
MYQKIAIAILLLCGYILPASAGDSGELTTDDLHAVVATAKTWKGTPYRYGGKDRRGIDCSHFVYSVYNRVFEGISYRIAEDFPRSSDFNRTQSPHIGDTIYFPSVNGTSAHVGILTDVESRKFIGAQSSTGVKEASYAKGSYWGKRPYQILSLLNK